MQRSGTGRAATLGWRDPAAYESALRRLEWPMLGLSIIFVVVLVAPGVVALPAPLLAVARWTARVIWAAFAAEVAVLLWTAPSKPRALRDHWLDIVIVFAPFLRVLHVGRLLRVVRATSLLGRAAVGANRILTRRGVPGVMAVSTGLIVGLGLLAWAYERQDPAADMATPVEGLWWALVTSTTVGYGDYVPLTPEGRVIAGLLMIVGVALLSVITASVAAFFVEQDTETDLRDQIAGLEAKVDQLLRTDRSS